MRPDPVGVRRSLRPRLNRPAGDETVEIYWDFHGDFMGYPIGISHHISSILEMGYPSISYILRYPCIFNMFRKSHGDLLGYAPLWSQWLAGFFWSLKSICWSAILRLVWNPHVWVTHVFGLNSPKLTFIYPSDMLNYHRTCQFGIGRQAEILSGWRR